MMTPERAGFMALATTCLRAEEHALQVHVDREIPLLGRALFDRLVLRRAHDIARVVHQNVDLAELLQHRIDLRFDLVFVAHVAGNADDPLSAPGLGGRVFPRRFRPRPLRASRLRLVMTTSAPASASVHAISWPRVRCRR